MNGDGTADPRLMDLVLRDLAAVHGTTVDVLQGFYEGQYFAWDWLHNPNTMGQSLESFIILQLIDSLYHRCLCVLRAWRIRRSGLRANLRPSCWRTTLHRRRGYQFVPCVSLSLVCFPFEAYYVYTRWVAGALDSAWRAVYQYLSLHNPVRLPEFLLNWGPSEYWSDEQLENHLRLAIHSFTPSEK